MTRFEGACDASAAATLKGTALFIAASDEDSVLRVYDRERPGRPLVERDVTAFLQPDEADETEADIEGAAQLGDRIYWIGSHGRSKKGKERKIRQRLFATTVSHNGGRSAVDTVGSPYTRLLHDLIASPALAHFRLAGAAQKKPEEAGGLSIEGLAPTRSGHLLIGFRNPIPNGRALIVRVHNPQALVQQGTNSAELSLAGLLDLGGRGIRAIEFVPGKDIYLLIAGAFDDTSDFKLYQWSGKAHEQAVLMEGISLEGLRPEELLVIEQPGGKIELILLTDDGDAMVGAGVPCKQAAASQRTFGAVSRMLIL